MTYLVYVASTVDPSQFEIQLMDADQLLINGKKVLQHVLLRPHEEKMRLSFLQQRYPYKGPASQ